MDVQCLRDNTIFEAVPEPYPGPQIQTHLYDMNGDKFIECPTCGRRYFYYNHGTDLEENELKLGWFSDRELRILEE
jgi:uncharacterized protein with PIN domain